MRVLVACEFSGTVRDAFRGRGHHAFSCDYLADVDNSPYHIQCDVAQLISENYQDTFGVWDLMIAHPPCTHLATSGRATFHIKKADGRQDAALDFVRLLMEAPIDRICIENPIGIISTRIRKPDQIINPYNFGHEEQKATCLWLKGLPVLKLNGMVWAKTTLHSLGQSKARASIRSRTFLGIAEAMAIQWGVFNSDNRSSIT